VPQAGLRVREAAQMGFTRVVLPSVNVQPGDITGDDGCELVGVRSLGEALDALIA
jgi:predicted ATP-dependent serine protease